MARGPTKKGDSKQETSSPRVNALADARKRLTELQDSDPSTGQWSVDNCAEMLRYWQGVFLDADRRIQTSTGAERLRAMSDRSTASREAGEWEKRKAGALMGIRVDLLRDVLRRLDEQDAMSDELLEIEE